MKVIDTIIIVLSVYLLGKYGYGGAVLVVVVYAAYLRILQLLVMK